MSIAQNPVMGKMAKSFANVNTYVHRGQNVISAKAFNRKDANTEAQQAHRASFKLIADVYQSLGGYAESGFPVRPAKQSAYNSFVSVNLPNAIDTSGQIPVIDYSKLQVAKGSLPLVNVLSAISGETGLTLSYDSNIEFPNAGADNVLIVLAKTKAGALYVARQPRGIEVTGSLLLTMPNVAKADIEFVYVFLTTLDGKKTSNSVFVEIS
jgi:hypothetical protein